MDNPETAPSEALARAHAALREELNGLEGAAHAPAEVLPLELRNDLERVRACLLEHFRFEEANGYMNHVLRRAPNLERTAEQLRQEHWALAQALDALLEEASHPRLAGPVLRDRVLVWLEQVRAHESRENLLAEEAFNRDLTAED